ncbi:MAG UNVERIFIED_CONTAM: hypothetical protein LVT10_00800 [Anaerolineae bacterium]
MHKINPMGNHPSALLHTQQEYGKEWLLGNVYLLMLYNPYDDTPFDRVEKVFSNSNRPELRGAKRRQTGQTHQRGKTATGTPYKAADSKGELGSVSKRGNNVQFLNRREVKSHGIQ